MNKKSSTPSVVCTSLSHRIRSLSVMGGFLDGQKLELADGLNCIIGARGTGKTTLLEFMRFALDVLPDAVEHNGERRRIEVLVDSNLSDGQIAIELETKDGLEYVVVRASGEPPMVLTLEQKPTGIALRSGGLFDADIYSQNEIERIADQAASQLAIIDKFASERVATIEVELRKIKLNLSTNAGQIVPLQAQDRTLAEDLNVLPSVEDRLKSFVSIPGANGKLINQAHADKAMRDREKQALDGVQRDLKGVVAELGEAATHIDARVERHFCADLIRGRNGKILSLVKESLHECSRGWCRRLREMAEEMAHEIESIAGVASNLAKVHDGQELEFREITEKHVAAQGQATERARWEKLRTELANKQRQREEIATKLQQLQAERRVMLRQMSDQRDLLFQARREIASQITKELGPAIRVSVIQYGDLSAYQQKLESALKAARLRAGPLAQKLVACFGPADLAAIVREGNAEVIMDKTSFSREQVNKIMDALVESDLLFDLETVDLPDSPRIELKDGDAHKCLAQLSTGQKCTAILPILLLESDNPLLVDQPEDNLDNRFIYETIVSSIRAIKKRRQLVFVTHNPNIPVLGDAERVFVLRSDGEAARVVKQGNVDECKEEIVTLLEGGAEAFQARQQRYDY